MVQKFIYNKIMINQGEEKFIYYKILIIVKNKGFHKIHRMSKKCSFCVT